MVNAESVAARLDHELQWSRERARLLRLTLDGPRVRHWNTGTPDEGSEVELNLVDADGEIIDAFDVLLVTSGRPQMTEDAAVEWVLHEVDEKLSDLRKERK